MFYGWIHENVGVLVQAKAGKGKLLICTFSLATTYNSDPYATYLLDALVNYAVSDFSRISSCRCEEDRYQVSGSRCQEIRNWKLETHGWRVH